MQTHVLLVIPIKDYSYKIVIVFLHVHQELMETLFKPTVSLVIPAALLVYNFIIIKHKFFFIYYYFFKIIKF